MFEVPRVLLEAASALSDEYAFSKCDALEHARAYFLGSSGDPAYAGSGFETIGHSWRDDRWINTITPSDLVALGTLSTPVDGYTPLELLHPDFRARATILLSQIPADADIAIDGDTLLVDGGPAGELYRLVGDIKGMGYTRTSKLLARKRPGLIPIRDQFVESGLNAKSSSQWWEPYRAMVLSGDPSPYSVAEKAREVLQLSPLVTPLRVIDAILWRSEEQRKAVASAGPT